MTLHQLAADPAAVLVAGAVLALAITVALCTLAVLGALRGLALEHECDRGDIASAIESAADTAALAADELAATLVDVARDLHDQVDAS
jgi:hypothetical protein